VNATTTMDRRYIHLQISAQRAAIGDPHDGKNTIDQNRIMHNNSNTIRYLQKRTGPAGVPHHMVRSLIVALRRHVIVLWRRPAPSAPPRVNAQFILSV